MTTDQSGPAIITQANEVINILGARLGVDEAIPLIGFTCPPDKAAQRDWWADAWMGQRLPRRYRSINTYVGISVFGPWQEDGRGIITPTAGQFMRRTKGNFRYLNAIMVDDIGTKVPLTRIKLEPSWKVCTSRDNWQYWYLIADHVTDAELAARFIKDLIAAGLTKDGTDPGMAGVSRVGRLPIGINNKSSYGRAEPVHGADFTFYEYTLTELAEGLGVGLDPWRPIEREAPGAATVNTETPVDFRYVLPVLEEGGMVLGDIPGGHRVRCPWTAEHTDGDESGAAYFYPCKANNWLGGFKCHHGHGNEANIFQLMRWAITQLENAR